MGLPEYTHDVEASQTSKQKVSSRSRRWIIGALACTAIVGTFPHKFDLNSIRNTSSSIVNGQSHNLDSNESHFFRIHYYQVKCLLDTSLCSCCIRDPVQPLTGLSESRSMYRFRRTSLWWLERTTRSPTRSRWCLYRYHHVGVISNHPQTYLRSPIS